MAERREAMVVGRSWREAVLQTMKRQREGVAMPFALAERLLAAFSPRGVAALPSPRRLAEKLAEISPRILGSFFSSGKRKERRGERSFASFSVRLHWVRTSMIPVQRQMVPVMEMQRLTAEEAPSREALATWSVVPVRNAKRTEREIMAVQR